MATKAPITPEQYLAMLFPEPEPEYVRGEMVQRPLPDDPHAPVQPQLARLLLSLESRLVRTELRIRIQPEIIRISHIGIIDPQRRTLHIYNQTVLISVPALTLPPHGFSADIEQLTQGL